MVAVGVVPTATCEDVETVVVLGVAASTWKFVVDVELAR
jgi:hypothetical protein